MKVTSDFKDYYDGMAAHDREPTPRYVRFTRVINFMPRTEEERAPDAEELREHTGDAAAVLDEINVHMRYGWGALPDFQLHVVCFCGRAYPLFELAALPRPKSFAFTMAQLDKLVEEAKFPRDLFADPIWRAWLSPPRVLTPRSFVGLRTPAYLLTGNGRLVLNPRLVDVGFARVLAPAQAWQELNMFLDNALVATGVEPRPITDELKAHAHGFDKQSFRKSKAGRKATPRDEW